MVDTEASGKSEHIGTMYSKNLYFSILLKKATAYFARDRVPPRSTPGSKI